ncbi:glycosyltransferase [Kitasatospora aureofaciens]|uniref:Uncharacterized protein n=1 Tax=Kitasatospora aureofaciens TaxID=1894 RepID=A0A1E7NC84_KITAU|nr:glycosyltransferase [Kitasatospora aureofaciens]QEV01466.1 glycosyltransferase [Streptomyces viridifaciens]ARF80213.1 hypothetical protein B6264_16000 [Kitasatospora aureofaciens]OEV38268.1 hypothetical protein HS99_0022270 [Kitasatospora aureofaciens]UKZ07864.1 glycosyltransferase [Streptomyces viridifaciens]GGU97590.1 hypothetical protein GCM10010502_59810 [Kitasatospora aureofaciens]
MTAPDVTVVVAVHDTVPHLPTCLDSLVGQPLARERLEVVVVDDGSTDGGEALLDEYAAWHPGLVRLVHQPDQPFTPEACLRADRVSVLADYDCCCPVPREEDRGDSTEWAPVLNRLRGIAALQQVADELAESGEESEAIRARTFAWDVPRLLRADFLLLDDGLQRRVCAEIGRMVERFGAREVYHRLPVAARLRLELAAAVRPGALRDQIRYEAAHGEPPVVVDGRRHYAGFPAFRDARLGLPDELFLLREEPVFEAAPPLNLAQQLWRGAVPEQLRRRLRRHPAWRRLANSVSAGRG